MASKDRLINTVIIIFVVVGCFALYDQLAHLNQKQLLSVVGKAIAALSLPFGIAVKAIQYVISEKDRLLKLAESAVSSTEANKLRLDVIREDLAQLRIDLGELREASTAEDLKLDRRLVMFEARSGVAMQLEAVRAQVNELSDKFNQWLVRGNDKP